MDKKLLTKVLFLFTGFVFVVTILSNSNGQPIFQLDHNPNAKDRWKYTIPNNVGDDDMIVSFYAGASRIDDDGNVLGYIGVSAGWAKFPETNEIYYWAGAGSTAVGNDENGNPNRGMANAWVRVPGKAPKHDQGGRGDTEVMAGPNPPDQMQEASDWTTKPLNLAGNRSMTASAALSIDRARATVRVDISFI